jgi:hypothetical protein
MNEYTVLVGLPGCGKSYYGRALLKSLNKSIFLDDIKDFSEVILSRCFYDNIIIADPWLCDDKIRKLAVEKLPGAYWLFWENDPEQCWKNIQGRDSRVISKDFINDLSKKYHPPKVDMKVWRNNA